MIEVFGNNDGNFFLVYGPGIAFLNRDETELLGSLLKVESHDALVCEHTFLPKTYRRRKTLTINLANTCGYPSGEPTIFNTESLDVKTMQLIVQLTPDLGA